MTDIAAPADPSVVPVLRIDGRTVTVTTSRYRWRWSADTDEFDIQDAEGRTAVRGPLQPAVCSARAAEQVGSAGQVDDFTTSGFDHGVTAGGSATGSAAAWPRVDIAYAGVNGSGTLAVGWRFGVDDLRLEPFTYRNPVAENVVQVEYFAARTGTDGPRGLSSHFYVQPGITESSSVAPIIPQHIRLDMLGWLGRGSLFESSTVSQQWALPVHYFCGLTVQKMWHQRSSLTKHTSNAFCCGLATLPAGDLMLQHRAGNVYPVVRINGHRWGTADTATGPLQLGAELCWTLGSSYDEAIRAYYRALLASGHIRLRTPSAAAREVMSLSQFNTWGAQMADGPDAMYLTQQSLEQIYDDYRASGLRAGMFVIDAKWEGENGRLEHDPDRLPRFEELLDRMRADGHRIGLWAAFLRCDKPESHGLTTEHMLRGADGTPAVRSILGDTYYLFDASQPVVQEVLRRRATEFMRRYRPDFIKFDFGYELPSLQDVAPLDRSWSGERTLDRALAVVVGAMRAVNPDVVVMYYNLSPLLLEHVDVHGIDDVWVNPGEAHLEVNRRLFFSSLMGEIGVPTYGSGGYDWIRMEDIWFDTVASGALGSLGSFRGDGLDSQLLPRQVARFNGLNRLSRAYHHQFVVRTLGAAHLGGSTGAHAASWIREENGQVVLAALRTRTFDGRAVDAAVPGLLTADAMVAVGSMTAAALAVSRHWAVVPFEPGNLVLDAGLGIAGGTVTVHDANGTSSTEPLSFLASAPVVPLRTESADGSLVEWLELELW